MNIKVKIYANGPKAKMAIIPINTITTKKSLFKRINIIPNNCSSYVDDIYS